MATLRLLHFTPPRPPKPQGDAQKLAVKLQQLKALSPECAEEVSIYLDYLLGLNSGGRPQA